MSEFLRNRMTFKEIKKNRIIDEYSSIVNYEELALKEEDLKKMIICEKNILFHQKKSIEHLLALSETLYEAQQILANYKNGGFRKWFEAMGMKKDFVYMCLKRYTLYQNYKSEKVMAIPEKMVKELSTPNINLPKEQILEILESEKPTKKYEEKIQVLLSGHPTIKLCENYENEEIFLEKELKRKYFQIKTLQKDINKIEKRLDILKDIKTRD